MANIKTFTISGTSPATASTAVLGTAVGLGNLESIKIVAELVGATGGTLDVYLQWSPNEGTTWYDYTHYSQLAGGASAVIQTVSSDIATTAPVTIGKNTTPALAANTHVGGLWGDRIRVLCVAGSGTSVGAALSFTIYGRPKL